MTRHYLDHASTSPLRSAARDALVTALDELTGDPGRIHTEGMTVRAHLEDARERVAACFGARSREVVFTSGATESIAMAIHGTRARRPHVVASRVEHSAVLSGTEQGPHALVGCDGTGRIDPDEVLAAVGPDTGLVHVQLANHEVGTVQPVAEIVERCRERDVLVHVDAATAAGRVPVDFAELGADLLSVSAHKLGGPLGIGALLVRRGLRLDPLLVGGDQERARRAGLENTPAALGFAAACDEVAAALADEAAAAAAHVARLTEALTAVDGVSRLGGDPSIPHLLCLGVAGVEPQAVLLGLDRRGIAAHSGRACASEGLEPSPVLEAMGVDADRSLRFSVGWNTSDADIEAVVAAFPPILADLRALAG